MNLYLTADGRYVGTQAEAKRSGKGWTPETVPTDKEGLIEYLNGLVDMEGDAGFASSVRDQLGAPDEPFLPEAAAPKPVAPNPIARFKLEQGREVDQITDYIMDVEGWALGNIVSAALERMAQLAKGIVR